jgi:hypothetical protein
MGGLVGTQGDKGVVDIGNGHEPPLEGHVGVLEAPGVARPVPLFVVGSGEDPGVVQEVVFLGELYDPLDGLFPDLCVPFHDLEFLGGQLAGFIKNSITDADLPHVVELGGGEKGLKT